MSDIQVGNEVPISCLLLSDFVDEIAVGAEFEGTDANGSFIQVAEDVIGLPKYKFRITEVSDDECKCLVLERIR